MVVQSTFSDLHRLHSWYASLIDFVVTAASVAVVSIAIKSKMPDKNFMSYEKIVAVVALPRFYVLNNTYICLHKYVSIYLHTNFYACCIFIFTQYLYSATRYKAQYIDLTIIKMTVLHNSKNIYKHTCQVAKEIIITHFKSCLPSILCHYVINHSVHLACRRSK